MPRSGNWGDGGWGGSPTITCLTGLEAVRKRPGMYLDLADPLLASKLLLIPLGFALEAGVPKVQVILSSSTSGTLYWAKAMSTEVRGTTGVRQAEADISEFFIGSAATPGGRDLFPGNHLPGRHDSVMGQLVIVNAACERFEITINDDQGEWNQRYRHGVSETDFKLMSANPKGDHTFLEVSLDTTWFEMAGVEGITFDAEFIQSWAADQDIEVEVILWT